MTDVHPPRHDTATVVADPPQMADMPGLPPAYLPAGYQTRSARHRSTNAGTGLPTWGWVAIGVTALALFVIVASVAAAFLYAGSKGAITTPAVLGGSTALKEAHETCATSSYGITLEDDGRTLDIDTMGEEELVGATYAEFECVLSALDVPGSVRSKMGYTRALDGMQTATWDGYSASWNYHPDDGVHMVISVR